MPWNLENIKTSLANGDTKTALDTLALLIGARPPAEQEALQWLAARYHGLLRWSEQEKISAEQLQLQIENIHNQLLVLLDALDEKQEKPIIPTENSAEEITLTFISSKKNIKNSFKTSPHRSVGSLKEALIRQFNIDTRVPLDYDNPATYLVVNRTMLTNDRLSLREAGVKDQDIIQIDVQYHIRMVWNQSVPTRLTVTFVGKTFTRPRVIVNNVLIAKPILLTDEELEIEFYTYNFTDTIKDLLFNFRFLDNNECLEFQEVLNVKGKIIDLRKHRALTVGGNKRF